MIKELRVYGFKTLVDCTVHFEPLTIMIGKNGAGKTAILDSLQVLGNFARGGAKRAFGPPPWSLGWLRSRGVGDVASVRFRLSVEPTSEESYQYSLSLDERGTETKVREERLMRRSDRKTLASFSSSSPPPLGTILRPVAGSRYEGEVQQVSDLLKSVVSYELNPKAIEQGVDQEHTYISRDGFGIAGYLAHLKDEDPERFDQLETSLKRIREETQAIEVWTSGAKLYWGLLDPGQSRPFEAVHLSWGDRQLVGLLCVLYSAKPGAVVAIEEVDRGFHPSRFYAILDLLTEAAYNGIDGQSRVQIISTTHSPSFINKLEDRHGEIRSVIRYPDSGTQVLPLKELLVKKLGPDDVSAPLGEIWEMGLLEDLTMPAPVA
jgi:predicted ATPase